MMKTLHLSILSLLIGVLIGCNNDEASLDREAALLQSSEEIKTWSRGEIQIGLGISQLAVPLEAVVSNVTIYNVVYKTTYKGEEILVSGRVFVPDTEAIVSTICFSHGTIAADNEAFTTSSASSGTSFLLSGLASLGFVVVAPDLIGFGASSVRPQAYYLEEPTAVTSIDNIYASRILAGDLGVKVDNELYLAGYSQGGYSTMATHKYIEDQGIKYFELKASFPAAGGYDIKGVQEEVFSNETYDNPFYLGLITNAYFTHYDWADENRSLSMFFNNPYADLIPSLIDGSKSGEQINQALTDTLSVLIQLEYLQSPNAPKYAFINEAYNENSPTYWKPAVPIFMYHGDADVTVPYQNSSDVYDGFIEAGASKEIVTFTTLEGSNHISGAGPYIESLVAHLLQMENE